MAKICGFSSFFLSKVWAQSLFGQCQMEIFNKSDTRYTRNGEI